MQENLPKTYSILAVILILACIVAGYFIFNTFLPAYNQSKINHDQVVANNTQLTQALASVQTFLTNYKQQEGNAARVNRALPAGQDDMPNFISSLSQLAQGSGVALSNFQIVNAGAETGIAPAVHSVQTEDLGLTASGSYASFRDFLQRVENHLRLIDIYHISVSTGSTQGDSALLQFQLKIHTYFQE